MQHAYLIIISNDKYTIVKITL